MEAKIQEIRSHIPKFIEELNYEIYLNRAGLKDEQNTSAIYEKYSFLLDKELMLNLKRSNDKAARYISAFLQETYIYKRTSRIYDKIATLETNTFIKVGDKKLNYRTAPIVIANEKNRDLRKEIYKARIKSFYPINKLYIKLWREMHSIAKELQYKNYLEYCSFVNLKDYNDLKQKAQYFLDKTKTLYIDLMEEEFKKIGLDFKESERHDLAFFFRASIFDEMFKKESMLDVFNSFLENFSLNLKSYPNIILDTEYREKKVTRAFVSPVKIPDRIYLVITPKGGQDDYLTLFHEAGHAFHFANIAREQAEEFKYLGPSSITETFAFLFEYLLLDKEFLNRYLRYNADYIRFQYLYKLYFLRRYCSKLLYEIELNTKGIDKSMGFLYKRIMEENMITKHERVSFLNDIDPQMYTAEYLEAWFFEAQLKNYLKEKYGNEWFRNAKAKEFLKEIWSKGFEFNPNEIARELGYKGVEVNFILEEIIRNLTG